MQSFHVCCHDGNVWVQAFTKLSWRLKGWTGVVGTRACFGVALLVFSSLFPAVAMTELSSVWWLENVHRFCDTEAGDGLCSLCSGLALGTPLSRRDAAEATRLTAKARVVPPAALPCLADAPGLQPGLPAGETMCT